MKPEEIERLRREAEAKLREQQVQAHEAHDLLTRLSPTFERLRAALTQEWSNSIKSLPEDRERLFQMLVALNDVERLLIADVNAPGITAHNMRSILSNKE